jgi:hypothetical protein
MTLVALLLLVSANADVCSLVPVASLGPRVGHLGGNGRQCESRLPQLRFPDTVALLLSLANVDFWLRENAIVIAF